MSVIPAATATTRSPAHSVGSLVALPIALLDRGRLAWLRALGPLAPALMRSRELRVALAASIGIALALALTAVAPLWMLALGPVLLGVPHAASDVRYLVTRPGLHRSPRFWLMVALPLVALTATVDVRWGLAAIVGGALAGRGAWTRRLAVASIGALLLALAWDHTYGAALFAAHAHNFVALAMWLAWRRRATWLHLIPLAALALGCALIASGALDAIVMASEGWAATPGGTGAWYHLASIAPGLDDPWGPRLVLLFAFAQSVHYTIWIRLVPEEDRARETPRTFAASLRAWRQDSGTLVVALAMLLSVAVALWALVDLAGAREGYLRGVISHGYLELAIASWWLVEGRALRTDPRARLR
ncbi:hypothetical protein [Sandaracinus amylolyticus]|uniref:hypothetical protein n=1 Tax=Sandaracinus amylolyticus TaxID=927083 RepID=UPI00069E5B1C|nr:hypothetical protein [Sandaracinus amylolyticus]